MYQKISLLTLFLFMNTLLHAQSEPAMADAMRSNGKIYVVVAVLAIIFTCIAIYLFILDRKMTRLEKLVQNQKSNN